MVYGKMPFGEKPYHFLTPLEKSPIPFFSDHGDNPNTIFQTVEKNLTLDSLDGTKYKHVFFKFLIILFYIYNTIYTFIIVL